MRVGPRLDRAARFARSTKPPRSSRHTGPGFISGKSAFSLSSAACSASSRSARFSSVTSVPKTNVSLAPGSCTSVEREREVADLLLVPERPALRQQRAPTFLDLVAPQLEPGAADEVLATEDSAGGRVHVGDRAVLEQSKDWARVGVGGAGGRTGPRSLPFVSLRSREVSARGVLRAHDIGVPHRPDASRKRKRSRGRP